MTTGERACLEKSRIQVEECHPVILMNAKMRQLVGNFRNGGAEYCLMDITWEVEVLDFVNGNWHGTPYGLHDRGANGDFLNVGGSHDTAEFAVDGITEWWLRWRRVR